MFHHSLGAIAATWALTAFTVLLLITCIFLLRYSPHIFTGQKQKIRSRFFSSSSAATSTPSSQTLRVSGTSSYTLPALNSPWGTPPRQHHNPAFSRYQPGPSTPQKSSPGSSQKSNSTAPATSKSSSNSNGSSSSKKKTAFNTTTGPPNLFFPASESPKCLSFLEAPSLTSTPRKSYARLPANNNSNRSGGPSSSSSHKNSPLASGGLSRYRHLRKHLVISAVLLFLTVVLYVIEGFAIVAAQEYHHVQVLHHLGKGGKEDEKWLMAWITYVLIQGGLLCWAVWMVVLSSIQFRKAGAELFVVNDKKKGDSNDNNSNKRPRENASGDIELQDFGVNNNNNNNGYINDEEEGFLPDNNPEQNDDEDVFRDGTANQTLDEEEAEEWRVLGFVPTTSDGSPVNNNPHHSTALQQQSTTDSNGEGSSSGPSYSTGFDWYFDEAGVPLPDLPVPGAVAKQMRGERSSAEMAIQKRNRDANAADFDAERARDQNTSFQVGSGGKDLRNSWEREDKEEGKGKGKEKEVAFVVVGDEAGKKMQEGQDTNVQQQQRQQPKAPKHELTTGIDPNTDYKFDNHNPYPQIATPNNKLKRKPIFIPEQQLPSPSTPTIHRPRNENDIAYPYPLRSPTSSISSSSQASTMSHFSTPYLRSLAPPAPPSKLRFPFDPINNIHLTPPHTPTPGTRHQSPFASSPASIPPPPPLYPPPAIPAAAARIDGSRPFTFSTPKSVYPPPASLHPEPKGMYAASATFMPFVHGQGQGLQASPSFESAGKGAAVGWGSLSPSPSPLPSSPSSISVAEQTAAAAAGRLAHRIPTGSHTHLNTNTHTPSSGSGGMYRSGTTTLPNRVFSTLSRNAHAPGFNLFSLPLRPILFFFFSELAIYTPLLLRILIHAHYALFLIINLHTYFFFTAHRLFIIALHAENAVAAFAGEEEPW
ncbi:MAG: hypothetical protein Q9168_006490 [Polycauliona sp. 1 TL-2023]